MDQLNEPQHYLIGHLQEAFAADPRVNELGIGVTVAGKKVFLTGKVATQQRKDAITEVARETLPDHEVHNQISLEGCSDTEEVERL